MSLRLIRNWVGSPWNFLRCRGAAVVVLSSCVLALSCTPGSDVDGGTGLPDIPIPMTDTARDAPRGDTGPPLSDVLIYAHSSDTLFTFSPFTNTVSTIGLFTLPDGSDPPSMLDLAVNAAGDVYTASADTLYRVDPLTAVATPIADFDLGRDELLYALTFVVAGVLSPDSEVMIGATNAGVLYRVDVTNARTTMIGTYPDGWQSSGDIVSVAGLGTFATLKRPDFDSDVVAQLLFDTSGRATVVVLGACGYQNLFGLGYWGRNLYGFTLTGQLLQIDRTSGAATIATDMTGTPQFYGAGVTTVVEVVF